MEVTDTGPVQKEEERGNPFAMQAELAPKAPPSKSTPTRSKKGKTKQKKGNGPSLVICFFERLMNFNSTSFHGTRLSAA